jgi:alkylation response protein AidB-like acyl-CoA dehydrogenase
LKRYLDGQDRSAVQERVSRQRPDAQGQNARIMQELVEFGMVSGAVSEAKGGMGIDFLTSDHDVRGGLRLRNRPVDGGADQYLCAKMLETLAPAHIQERYLPGMVKGELFGCMAFSEPDVGSNVLEIKARARVMAMTTSSAAKSAGSAMARSPTS